MTKKTPNLNLTAFDTTVDSGSSVYDYINTVSGSKAGQNLLLLDNFAGAITASMVNISGSISTLETKASRTKSAVIQVVAPSTAVNINSGFSMFIPSELDGMNIYRVKPFVNTAGSVAGQSLGIQVRNETKYSGSPALTTPILITSPNTSGSAGSINTNYDAVSTDDLLRIYMTQATDASPLGLQVVLEFQYP